MTQQDKEKCIKDEMKRGHTRKFAERFCDLKVKFVSSWQNWRDLHKEKKRRR